MSGEAEKKEQRGIYNVVYNGKNAAYIQKDLENIEEAILLRQGYHKKRTQGGKGAKHIKIRHLTDETKEGYVTDNELVNLGRDLRSFLEKLEPFAENEHNGKKSLIYEWENKDGVRFRLVTSHSSGGTTAHSHSSSEEIITFYSDRNLNERMKFKRLKGT